jgi:hypothetical protein
VLGLKAGEARVVLREQAPRTGQHQPRTLCGEGLGADADAVRGGVVLHFCPQGLVVLARALHGRAQARQAHPAGERAVGELAALLLGEQLLGAHRVAASAFEGRSHLGQELL